MLRIFEIKANYLTFLDLLNFKEETSLIYDFADLENYFEQL